METCSSNVSSLNCAHFSPWTDRVCQLNENPTDAHLPDDPMAALQQELAESQRNLKRVTDYVDLLEKQVEEMNIQVNETKEQSELLNEGKPTQHCPPKLHSLGTQARIRQIDDLSDHLRMLANVAYWQTSSAIVRVKHKQQGWEASQLVLDDLQAMRNASYQINICLKHNMQVSLGDGCEE
jgi:hypothetical protein